MLERVTDEVEGGMTYKFVSPEAKQRFKESMAKHILVVWRASPSDKHMFVSAIKQLNTQCAVTGESFNDAMSLKEASVGFAMGNAGCAVAKDNSDIIILDDNYASIMSAAKWGRNLFDNCRKFVQFQMTVNISCIIFVIIGGTTLGKSPFTVFQLLWINLIMDVLAAIALASETPHPTQLRKERIKKKDKIITPFMKRTIMSQVIYQLVVMLTMLYFGEMMFNFCDKIEDTDVNEECYYDMVNDALTADGGARMRHYSFLFQCFVLMNVFNTFNCRKLPSHEDPEYNVFSRLHTNIWFIIVVAAEFVIQWFFATGALKSLLLTSNLDLPMSITALSLGVGSLIVAAITKATPAELVYKFPDHAEEAGTTMMDNL